MNRLNTTLLLAELLCLALIVIGNRLVFWQELMIGWLIIGIAACMSVLIVLVLVFHETEEKKDRDGIF